MNTIGDLQVSGLCLGGNVFGWTADEAASFAVLDAYVAAGQNFIDTADSYSAWVDGHTGGESETVLGRWLARGGRRDDVVLATKVGRHPAHMGLSADTIKAAADASLRRLGVDHIDLYYTHFDDESVEVAEIITALDDLVRAGKVREIGASNITPARLEASLAFSTQENKARYTALQPRYNLMSRDSYEGPLADLAARHDLAVMPYSALAGGFLTGKYRQGAPVRSARSTAASRHLETDRGRAVLSALDEVATAHGTELSTIALAWLAAQPTITAPLASARTPDQLPPLLNATPLTLTEADLTTLTNASA